MANYGRNFVPDQRLFLGNQGGTLNELRGVQSVAPAWDKPEETLVTLGEGYVGAVTVGALENTVSINRLMVTQNDPVTGNLGKIMDGVLVYGPNKQFNKSVIFSSGYITSYSSSCSVGDVPSADLEVTSYGSVGKGDTGSFTFSRASMTEPTEIPLPGNISLNVSGYTTNAIQSYNISIPLGRERIPTVGNNFLNTGSFVTFPIQVTVGFEMTVNTYEFEDVKNVLCTPVVQDLTFQLNTCSGSKIRGFSIPTGRLVGLSTDATVQDNLSASLSYVAYFNSVEDLQNIFS